VRIVAGPVACEAVRALKGMRFLSAEAPRIPLPRCPDRPGCRCVYQHLSDRRAGPRRAVEQGAPPRGPATAERRVTRGRRLLDV
jgi:hypothetical protein